MNNYYNKIKKIIANRLRLYSILIVSLLLISQLLGLYFFPLELITHFTLHGTLLVLLGGFTFKSKFRYLLWILCLTIIGLSFYPYFQSTNTEYIQSVLSYNIKFENNHKTHELDFILQTNADVLALVEIGGSEWKTQLNELQQKYPYNCSHNIDSPFAMIVLSKNKMISCEVNFVDIYPFIRAVFPKRTIFLLHPPPPVNKELANDRLQYFKTVATIIANENNDLLVVGDLNNTPYSPIYRKFIQQARIKDSLKYQTTTWKPAILPIDRVLYRCEHQVLSKPLSWQYSDHKPILTYW
ncbi:MAG: endonuclease/exonuclease/phosphatase family protein [Neisseriaceae bacterium]|nr:endonuclease/exonuclease/phosphatase family protein [Neisseriaceae bacterium]